MSTLENFYFLLPLSLQQFLVAVYGVNWYRRRFSKHFHQLVKEFKDREYWSKKQFIDYQNNRLQELMTSAWNSVYYKEVFIKSGISSSDTKVTQIDQLPLLTKETLRERYKDLLTSRIPRGTIIQKSSGTTGTPSYTYYTKEFHAFELAVPEARNLNWAGVTYKDKRIMFGVRKVCSFDQDRPPFWRFSPIENMAYASIYHLSPKYLPHYIDFLRSYQPSIIMGYPSALYSIARFALENNKLPAPARVVITMAETLESRVRNAIEDTWKCRVFDRYGAVEGCMFVSQCEYGKYHVSPEVGIIEILDQNGDPCPLGKIGEVVCTGLQNTLQPLIRYRVGDAACWAEDQSCQCNRQMPIIERIEGRYEDICYTKDGREILRFDTVFKGLDSIKEAQVVQESFEKFLIYVVPSDGFNEDSINLLLHNMKLHVGEIPTEVKVVDHIERSPSGKFRAVISKVPRL